MSIERTTYVPGVSPEGASEQTHSLRIQLIAGATVLLCATGVTTGFMTSSAVGAKRELPSGDTCKEKVKFYTREGAIFGKVDPSDCESRPQIGLNITAVERAGGYFDFNPVGGVAVSACESGLTETAVGQVDPRDSGLFQQHNPYWYGRLRETQQYINTHTKPVSRAIKLSPNIFNARSNAFVSVHMLRKNGGASNWAPSQHCWSAKYGEVAGSSNRWRDFINESPIRRQSKRQVLTELK